MIEDKLRKKLPEALLLGGTIWPVATMINFKYVPQRGRVVFIAGISAVINVFLSWTNAREESVFF